MKWLRFFRNRAADREIEVAMERAARSDALAQAELKISTGRLRASQSVARELARHNSANRYDDWLESHFLRGGS